MSLASQIAPGHAEGVLDGAVGFVTGRGVQVIDEGEFFAVIAAVGIQAVGEGSADALLIVRAAKFNRPLQLLPVVFYVGV